MHESVLAHSTNEKLQPFLLLSKSVKGAANAKLILDALAAPGVYVFTELYQAPNVVEASVLPEVAPYYALLEIFLHGTYRDYAAQRANLPPLNDAQLTKLKHLTIVTLSETNRTLAYDKLQEYLDIPNVRWLEDLIIDAFYQGILVGKLDQRRQQLQVDYAMGRDIQPQHLDETIQVLKNWSDNTTTVLAAIDAKIQDIHESIAATQREREEYERQLEAVRHEIHNHTASPTAMDTDDPLRNRLEFLNGDRTGRAKKRCV